MERDRRDRPAARAPVCFYPVPFDAAAGAFGERPCLVHQWGNPGNEPLTFLAFNINPEGVPAVVPETPAKP